MKNDTYYIWGDEAYLVNQEINKLVTAQNEENGESDILYLDVDEMSANELGESLEFSPLFSLGRVVIIKNPSWLNKSVRRPKKAEEVLAVLDDYFEREHPRQILVFSSREMAASNPIAKRLQKRAEVIAVKKPTPAFLEGWLKNQCQQKNLNIQPVAIKTAANSGQDLYCLEQLVEKLSLMQFDKPVGVKELEEELDSRQEIKVFKLTDSLLNKNLRGAFQAFNKLQEQGEHHLLMMTIINRQFITLAKVKYYQEQGLPRQQIESLTGQKEYTVKKMVEKNGNFSWDDLRSLFELFLKLDISFKSESRDPRILMETLFIKICSMSG